MQFPMKESKSSGKGFGEYFGNMCEVYLMNRKMTRIAYIYNDTAFGGAGLSLVDTLTVIKKKHIEPIVIIRKDSESEIKDKFDEVGVRYYEIAFCTDWVKKGCVDEEEKRTDLRQSYEAALELIPIIKKEKIQLIHINSSVSYFAAIAALMEGIPYVWHIRELIEEHYGGEYINIDLKKCLYLSANKIIAISDYVKKNYLEKYNIQTRKIYDGLNIEKYAMKINQNCDFSPTFLVAGMITPEKGQWDAICATENLIKRGYADVELVIVGDTGTSYTWALKKYIKERGLDRNISILPFRENLSSLRERVSYEITCSQNEALGRVAIEAMLAGNFVIGARSGATTEIIGKNEERGFLYEIHSSRSLADAMLRAMECPKEIKRKVVESAQIYAENTFDSKVYCRALGKLYAEIIISFKPKKQEALLENLKTQYDVFKGIKMQCSQENNIQYWKSERALMLALKWLELKQKGYSLNVFFERNHIRSVAIYGMAALGCRLYDELEYGNVEVKYLMDQNPMGMEKVFEFVPLERERVEVDAVVVTVAGAEREVVREIKTMGYQRVIGLSEILTELYEEVVLQQ